MSTTQKTYKKGEILFKDGDKIQNVIFIQSGGVNQCLHRGKKVIDLFQLGTNQAMGEASIIGHAQHTTSAVATVETKTIEVSVEALKTQYEGAPPVMRMLIKSLIERLKQALGEVRSAKISADSTPCPDENVPQIYGSIFFTARHKGEAAEKGTDLTVDWGMMKSYCQRVMGQSIKRLEQAINILVKLKLAKYEMGKLPEDPDGPDVITKVIFHDIAVVEAFFEFYQYYHYKPGKGEILKYDDFCAQLLECFVAEGDKLAADRFGVVGVEFVTLTETVKERIGVTFNNDHFARLETKGLFCKRRNVTGQGVFVEFEIKEFRNVLFSWKILRELDKWNEKGFVDIDEQEERKVRKNGGPACPQCSVEVAVAAKFCHECGAKLAAPAA